MWIIVFIYLVLFFIVYPFPKQLRFVKKIETFTPDDIFYSFLPDPIDGKYMGFYRTDASIDSNLQQVFMDSNFNITKTDLKLRGMDPRLFKHKNRTYVIDNYFDNMHIIDVETLDKIKIDLPGKNFIFFSYRDKLYIIHKILPLELYEFDIDKKILTKVYSGSEPENSDYRGGTMGYIKGDIVYGYGHITRAKLFDESGKLIHDIFYWELDMNTFKLKIKDIEQPHTSSAVTDPTCIINIEGNKYIITAESHQPWMKNGNEMEYMNKIYIII